MAVLIAIPGILRYSHESSGIQSVGNRNRFSLILEGLEGQHRPDDFPLENFRPSRYIGKERGQIVETA